MTQKSNREVESPSHAQANQLGSRRALRPLGSSLKQRSRGWVGSVLPASSQLLCCQEAYLGPAELVLGNLRSVCNGKQRDGGGRNFI